MNQVFNKKVLAASVAAACMSGGMAYANTFADSTVNSVSAGVVVKGGALKMTSALTLTELGTYAGAVGAGAQPIGVRITIPAGVTLYGAKVTTASTANSVVAQANATALSLTAGTTYALRLTQAGGPLSAQSAFVVIDTNSSSGNATNLQSASNLAGADQGAIYALFAAATPNVSNQAVAVNGWSVSASGLGAANTTATNGTSFLSAGGVGTLIFTPNQATTSATNGAGLVLRLPNGNLADSAGGFPVGSLTANSDGTMTMVMYTSSSNTTGNNGDTLVVPPLVMGVGASSTATGSLALTVADGTSASPTSTNLVGISATSVNVLTVATSGIAVAKNSSTSVIPVDVQGLANQSVDPIKVTFATPVTAAKKNILTLTLDNNAKFVTGTAWTGNYSYTSANAFIQHPTSGVGNATMFNTGDTTAYNATNCSNSLDTASNCTAGILSNNNATLTLTMDNESIASGDAFVLTGAMLDMTSAGTGAVNLTVTQGTASNSIQVASVAAKGTSVAYADVAPTGFTTLYTGRTGQTTTDSLVITETAAGSLSVNGAVILTASNGALFTQSATTATAKVDTTSSGTVLGVNTLAITGTSSASLTGSIGTASTTASKATVTGLAFDLSSATAGDLTLTVSGGSGASGSAKVATIVDASSASVSGAVAVGSAGGSVTLPDIVITESGAGAIVNGATNYAVVAVPTSQVSALDMTGATIKAYDSTGVDISTLILGAASATGTVGTVANTAYMRFATANASTGPVTIKVSGMKATLANTAVGDVTLTVAGAASTTPDLAVAVGAGGNEISSNVGAKLTKKTVKAASVVGANQGYYPTPAVTGPVTAQTITSSMVPSSNDQGNQGSVFVAAVLPASMGNGVYFMDSSSAWTLFTSCTTAPAYTTGTLAAVSGIPVVKTALDLTSLVGTVVYVGYGKGGGLSPAGTACNNMLSNGSYSAVYTVK